jgi:hypothetical protein
MAKAPCKECGEAPKHGTSHRCVECLLRTKPMVEQVAAARSRLAMTPPELRRARVPASEWPAGRRWCSGCQSFVRLRDCTGSRCKACASDAAHAGSVAKTYGITAEQYEALFAAQDGRCWICRRKSNKRLSVDHDHSCCAGPTSCGQCVRGLLCAPDNGCNRALIGGIEAIGRDREGSLAMARRIVAYLEDPPARRLLALP